MNFKHEFSRVLRGFFVIQRWAEATCKGKACFRRQRQCLFLKTGMTSKCCREQTQECCREQTQEYTETQEAAETQEAVQQKHSHLVALPSSIHEGSHIALPFSRLRLCATMAHTMSSHKPWGPTQSAWAQQCQCRQCRRCRQCRQCRH
jgi:hypothetical protein